MKQLSPTLHSTRRLRRRAYILLAPILLEVACFVCVSACDSRMPSCFHLLKCVIICMRGKKTLNSCKGVALYFRHASIMIFDGLKVLPHLFFKRYSFIMVETPEDTFELKTLFMLSRVNTR